MVHPGVGDYSVGDTQFTHVQQQSDKFVYLNKSMLVANIFSDEKIMTLLPELLCILLPFSVGLVSPSR